jgi:hypothetical protein
MDARKLQNQVGTQLRLRPPPKRTTDDGRELGVSDDAWTLEEILAGPTRVRLTNSVTGHVLILQSDNIREYRSPDFLMLRCQLTIRPKEIAIEPLFAPSIDVDANEGAAITRATDGRFHFHVAATGFSEDVRAFIGEARRRFVLGVISSVASEGWTQTSFDCSSQQSPEVVATLARKHHLNIACKPKSPTRGQLDAT